MAHTKSAIKKIRHDEKRRLANKNNRSKLRTQIRKSRELLNEKNIDALKEKLPATLALIDKSVHKKIIHMNTAARLKGRLTKHYNSIVSDAFKAGSKNEG